jgi:hypothetical protein
VGLDQARDGLVEVVAQIEDVLADPTSAHVEIGELGAVLGRFELVHHPLDRAARQVEAPVDRVVDRESAREPHHGELCAGALGDGHALLRERQPALEVLALPEHGDDAQEVEQAREDVGVAEGLGQLAGAARGALRLVERGPAEDHAQA